MHRIGSTEVEKVLEMDLNGMTLGQLMPDVPEGELGGHPQWLMDGATDEGGHALLSLHVWLVRYAGRTILVDTVAGNDKARPQRMVLDHLSNPLLERLAAAGVELGDVDLVFHTHIHSDHVGSNTRLADGEWIPTFANAEVICSDLEWRDSAALTDGEDEAGAACRNAARLGAAVREPVFGTFADSMWPLEGKVAKRRVRMDGSEVLPSIRYVPTPGHSTTTRRSSSSATARWLFSGDVFHHPVEIHLPELVSTFCEFPGAARRSRLSFMERAADSAAVVFTSHFALSSAATSSGHRPDSTGCSSDDGGGCTIRQVPLRGAMPRARRAQADPRLT